MNAKIITAVKDKLGQAATIVNGYVRVGSVDQGVVEEKEDRAIIYFFDSPEVVIEK